MRSHSALETLLITTGISVNEKTAACAPDALIYSPIFRCTRSISDRTIISFDARTDFPALT
jgi:hypothetical protein